MAKWGQGDPRWIVEERPDGTNVNNWHWTEKNASVWSQNKLQKLLVGLKFNGPEGSCETTEVPRLEGEATANNRKGKLIFFYEWDIKLKWTGKTVKEEEKKVSGEIEIPNLSEENEMEDISITVTLKKDSPEGQNLKDLMRREAPGIIREQLSEYLRCLKEEYSQDMILPRRGSPQPLAGNQSPPVTRSTARQNSLPVNSLAATRPGSRPSGSRVGCRIPTTKVTITETFMTSVEELYETLTTQELVEAFTRTKAIVEARKGGEYSILNGRISGEFVQLDRPNKIVQRWRDKSWPDGHYSTVTMELEQEADGAKLVLLQTEVPDSDFDRTKEGWKSYIFESIKTTFGYGARLL